MQSLFTSNAEVRVIKWHSFNAWNIRWWWQRVFSLLVPFFLCARPNSNPVMQPDCFSRCKPYTWKHDILCTSEYDNDCINWSHFFLSGRWYLSGQSLYKWLLVSTGCLLLFFGSNNAYYIAYRRQNVVSCVEGVPLFLSCRQFPISLELVCLECATRELPVEIDCVTECIGDCANCRWWCRSENDFRPIQTAKETRHKEQRTTRKKSSNSTVLTLTRANIRKILLQNWPLRQLHSTIQFVIVMYFAIHCYCLIINVTALVR